MNTIGVTDKDYYCSVIYDKLFDGPLPEAKLEKDLAKHNNIPANDVRECLKILQIEGIVKKTGNSVNKIWQLCSDELEDAEPTSSSISSEDSSLSTGISDLSLGENSLSDNADNRHNGTLTAARLPPPATRKSKRKKPNQETSVKTPTPTYGEHSLPLPSSSCGQTTTSIRSSYTSPTPVKPSESMHAVRTRDDQTETMVKRTLEDSSLNESTASLNSRGSLEDSSINDSIENGAFASFSSNEASSSSTSDSSSMPPGQSRLYTRTVQDSNGTAQTQYVSQTQRNPSMQTVSVGEINIETSAPVNTYQRTEYDTKLKPTIFTLQKILDAFGQGESLKPRDVARNAKLGDSKKAVNKYLYHLQKKKILVLKTDEGGKNPQWSKVANAVYSEKELNEWAAEIFYNSSSSTSQNTTPTVINHHHHTHQHQHTNMVQVGDNNTIGLTTSDTEADREHQTEGMTEQLVCNAQQDTAQSLDQ